MGCGAALVIAFGSVQVVVVGTCWFCCVAWSVHTSDMQPSTVSLRWPAAAQMFAGVRGALL
jgi:hypothetical protein